jgi:hypothetical protein
MDDRAQIFEDGEWVLVVVLSTGPGNVATVVDEDGESNERVVALEALWRI